MIITTLTRIDLDPVKDKKISPRVEAELIADGWTRHFYPTSGEIWYEKTETIKVEE